MDRLTAIMVRASLLWLLAGVALGGLMLVDRAVPGAWVARALPTHVHMVLVGWLLQFAVGVAYWLFPRRRTPAAPSGYRESAALVAVGALNAGLLLRVIGEPMERSGRSSGLGLGLLAASAALQVGAVAIFVFQLWPRVEARPRRQSAAP